MAITELILSSVALVGTASGWIAAYFARGASNDAGERARIAEAKAEAAVARSLDAEAGQAAARVELRAATQTADTATHELERERARTGELLERMSKLGIPVGDVLVDDALDRLYPKGHGAGGGSGAGSGGDPDGLPPQPAAAAPKTGAR